MSSEDDYWNQFSEKEKEEEINAIEGHEIRCQIVPHTSTSDSSSEFDGESKEIDDDDDDESKEIEYVWCPVGTSPPLGWTLSFRYENRRGSGVLLRVHGYSGISGHVYKIPEGEENIRLYIRKYNSRYSNYSWLIIIHTDYLGDIDLTNTSRMCVGSSKTLGLRAILARSPTVKKTENILCMIPYKSNITKTIIHSFPERFIETTCSTFTTLWSILLYLIDKLFWNRW